jgi:hypothetical protein
MFGSGNERLSAFDGAQAATLVIRHVASAEFTRRLLGESGIEASLRVEHDRHTIYIT